jgi:hypothetical protein
MGIVGRSEAPRFQMLVSNPPCVVSCCCVCRGAARSARAHDHGMACDAGTSNAPTWRASRRSSCCTRCAGVARAVGGVLPVSRARMMLRAAHVACHLLLTASLVVAAARCAAAAPRAVAPCPQWRCRWPARRARSARSCAWRVRARSRCARAGGAAPHPRRHCDLLHPLQSSCSSSAATDTRSNSPRRQRRGRNGASNRGGSHGTSKACSASCSSRFSSEPSESVTNQYQHRLHRWAAGWRCEWHEWRASSRDAAQYVVSK